MKHTWAPSNPLVVGQIKERTWRCGGLKVMSLFRFYCVFMPRFSFLQKTPSKMPKKVHILRGFDAFDSARVLHVLRAGPGGSEDPDGATWEPIDTGIKEE